MSHGILVAEIGLFGALYIYNAFIISFFNEHGNLRFVPPAVIVVLVIAILLHIVCGQRCWTAFLLLVTSVVFVIFGVFVVFFAMGLEFLSLFLDQHIAVATSIVDIWILPHLLLRWQLRNRRFAALDTAAILTALSKWITNPPPLSGMAVTPQKNVHLSRKVHPCKDRCYILLDYIFPFPHCSPPPPEGGLPKCLSKIIQNHCRNPQRNTHALVGEWLVTAGSIAILLTTIFLFYFA